MSLTEAKALTRAETDALLARHETAVLSLTDPAEPYATPTAYGYDTDACRFFLRPAPHRRGEIRAALSAQPRARLFVYEAAPPVYRSVLVVGTLEEVSRSELTVERGEMHPPVGRTRGERERDDRPKMKLRLYELDPTAVSGRRIENATDDVSNEFDETP